MYKYLFLTLILLAQSAWASDQIFQQNGVAVNGYDVVAYFENIAVKGEARYSQQWNGVAWHFANEGNRAVFAADPERYAPQYGGFCAYAMSKGSLAATDPRAWTIHNGKLYLNFSIQVRQLWKQDIDRNILLADQNWSKQ